MNKLDNRVAIITGGSRGQGEATARLFVSEGARVIIADVLEEEGQALASKLGDSATFAHLDITDEAAWNTVIDDTVNRWGSIDILINNAGIVHPAAIIDLEKSDFMKVLEINLVGSWLGMKVTAPIMIKQGKGAIINVCSTSALWGMNGLAAYSSSKWALRGLSKTAAMEFGRQGVRVNSIFPGGINTIMGNVANETPEEMAEHFTGQPIKRIGEPEEVAKTSLFLASDDSSYLCGAEITVDGGMILGAYNDFLPGSPNS